MSYDLAIWESPRPRDDENDGPWSVEPVIGDAIGGFLYLTIVMSAVAHVADRAAELAEAHGLVCFDPQLECLMPDTTGGLSAAFLAEEVVGGRQVSAQDAPTAVSLGDAVPILGLS